MRLVGIESSGEEFAVMEPSSFATSSTVTVSRVSISCER